MPHILYTSSPPRARPIELRQCRSRGFVFVHAKPSAGWASQRMVDGKWMKTMGLL